MRSQQHDFKNHIQIISSLAELKEYEELENYLHQTSQNKQAAIDKKETSIPQKTSQPSLNALFQAKIDACAKKNIKTEMRIFSKLDKLQINGWQLCRIIGNLIDNATEAMIEAKTQNPTVGVLIKESATYYEFIIYNNGPQIGFLKQRKIFKPNFSTKGENRGLGLTIVSQIVAEEKGKIEVFSKNKKTNFRVILPKAVKTTL